jgi:Arc/MetJ-type ribon-helix-helix transcriptional regulator
MTASQMTSLRVPEDHLALLDQRVGFDGMRNRSDVVRAAIALYLDSTPTHADVHTVKFDIGTETRYQLAQLYELRGTSSSEAARMGLELYLRQTLADSETLTMLLEARVEEMRARTRAHEDHTA